MEDPKEPLATKQGYLLKEPGVYISGAKVGRPFGRYMFLPEEFEEKAEAFIASFDPKNRDNEDSRYGTVPTITEFAYVMGASRRTILDYEKRDEYSDVIAKVKAFCEMHSEQKLFDPAIKGAGPIFNLKANYGWKDGNQLDVNVNIGWNDVQMEAKKRRRMLEDPDYVPEEEVTDI